MNKYFWNLLWNFGKLLFFSGVILVSIGRLFAAEIGDWSFEDHPHPQYLQLTNEEKLFMKRLSRVDKEISCKKKIAGAYKIYKDRYSDFKNSNNAEGQLKLWKKHIMKGNYHDLELCIVLNIDDILPLYYEDGIVDDLYFCGRFSRVPYTDAERRYAAAVTQLFDYVKLGNRRAAFFFFLNIGKNGPVLLNPDIEYYLRGLLPPAYEMDDGLDDTSHLEPLLTAERKAFLDAAIARRDFDSVLKTSPPCPPRERLGDEKL